MTEEKKCDCKKQIQMNTLLAQQSVYKEAVKQIMQTRVLGKTPLAFVRTYGCQQNVADSEKIKGQLAEMGFSFTDKEEDADFILFNTCAVREHAEDRIYGNVGALKHIKRRRPSVIIAICGCMMEQSHAAQRIKDTFPFVNLIFGTHKLHRLPQMLHTILTESRRVLERGETEEDKEIIEGISLHRDGKVKAWLTVMYGCNNFCSYCVVPYVRGRERSRQPQAIETEFEQILREGYKDITLLGQNVNSYGKNLAEKVSFSDLLRKLDAYEGEYRIRFMTSHPKDATKELIDTIAESKHISHHLHLPFQAGSNRILKEMNRVYTREEYLDLINYVKQKIPDVSLTSDVIVGFPGETYEEFQETLSLIKEVEFTSLFTFIYSPREGTKAAKMPDLVSHQEKTKWMEELLRTQEAIAAKRCAQMLGKTVRVLTEERGKSGELVGRTDGNIIVEFTGGDEEIGQFTNVEITQARNWILKGKKKENGGKNNEHD